MSEQAIDFTSMTDDEIMDLSLNDIESIPEDEETVTPVPDNTEENTQVEEPGEGEGEDEEEGESTYVPNEELLDAFKEPITMNGTEITINNAKELRRLVQQGLGSNKRMQELKPKMRVLGMLEDNELLDEAELSYLIDLKNGNKDAIKKLIADNKMDVMDFGDDEVNYSPNDYSVSEKSMELKEVVSEVNSLPTYNNTLQAVQGMDDSSKQRITDQPALLGMFAHDMESGVFTQIDDIITQNQAKGSMVGMDYVTAYETVVSEITEYLRSSGGNGQGHNGQESSSPNGEHTESGSPHNVEELLPLNGTGRPNNVSPQNKGNSRRGANSAAKKAASATSKPGKAVGSAPLDISGMSDDEIMKLDYVKLFGE